MKNAMIFHGTGCNPNSFWQPYIKNKLIKLGYKVWIPHLPKPDKPDLKNWLPFVLKNKNFIINKKTILIGHSAGSPFILSILENIKTKVDKAILVAGYLNPEPKTYEEEPILQKNIIGKK